ncbi:MAG TPA: sigma-70 family RNA polymerase sigma factor [Pirellulaceae bacterium]|nr:sigma-70 family RNA polymerase sigma factor [Pirellulaceae bacterium]
MSDVSRILAQVETDPQAAEQLLPLVYDELRKLAVAKLAHEKPGQTLQATALVHEAYLRLVGPSTSGGRGTDDAVGGPPDGPATEPGFNQDPDAPGSPAFHSRGHFLAAAATAMRHILIDAARRRQSQKRGGQGRREALDEIAAPEPDEELLALDEALAKLAKEDPQKARLVELRYFAGLTSDEAAEALGISPSTADRHWAFARAWLQTQVRGG